MGTRKVWESPSGHKRVEQAKDGTLYELTEDSSGKVIVDLKKIDAERLKDLMLDRPSRKGWQDRAK
jgi:hypothetical protein